MLQRVHQGFVGVFKLQACLMSHSYSISEHVSVLPLFNLLCLAHILAVHTPREGLLPLQGAVPMGEDQWEHERILSGRPRAGRELTEAHTPLEAGLWACVDLVKGCYIGQETLAKVSKLGALNRELWGIQLQTAVQPGDAVHAGE